MGNSLEFNPPLSLVVPGSLSLEFNNVDSLRTWVNKESEAWNGLLSTQQGPPYESWRRAMFQSLTLLQSVLVQLEQLQRSGSADAQGFSTQAQRALDQFSSAPWELSESLAGQELLQDVGRGEIDLAVAKIRFILQHNELYIPTSSYPNGTGVVEYIKADVFFRLYTRTIEQTEDQKRLSDAIRNAVQMQVSRFQDALDQMLKMHTADVNELNRVRSEFGLTFSEWDERRELSNRTYAGWLKHLRGEFSRLKAVYTRELQLSSPSLYWRQRSRQTATIAIVAFAIFLAGAVVAFLVGQGALAILKNFSSGPDGKIQVGAVLLISPLLILPIWLFRMLSRVFTTGLTESVDASQRRVMVTTFLALTKDKNSHLTEAERFIILQALFRSSSAKDEDDQVPASLMEALMKTVQGAK